MLNQKLPHALIFNLFLILYGARFRFEEEGPVLAGCTAFAWLVLLFFFV